MNVYVGQGDGTFIMQPPNEMPAGYDPRTRPWYNEAVSAGKMTLTEPYRDSVTKGLIITIATPVRSLTGQRGVAGGDLSLATLVKMISSIHFQGDGCAFLVDESEHILVHPDTSLVMKTLAEVYPTDTPKLSQKISENTLGGHAQVLTFARVNGLPSGNWYVGVALDKGRRTQCSVSSGTLR